MWFCGGGGLRRGHAAPFPVELPYRTIQLYTFEGEVVLDPFTGRGLRSFDWNSTLQSSRISQRLKRNPAGPRSPPQAQSRQQSQATQDK
ncbi:MAG: site-specific DNA-methyltransferase [Methanosarcinales archaeon]|nr:site-specific DNA-methyltransferase [Methanosarcinales archaeon]